MAHLYYSRSCAVVFVVCASSPLALVKNKTTYLYIRRYSCTVTSVFVVQQL